MAWRLFPRASPRACAIYIIDSTEKGDRSMPLEILDGALVLLSCLQALEGSQVPPLPRFGILLAGIKTVTAGGQLPDHPVTRSSCQAIIPLRGWRRASRSSRLRRSR